MENTKLPSAEIVENKNIEDCIFTIRGMQVMLDSDVAYFFGIETKNLNKQKNRNIDRFPGDFCFQLNSLEFNNLRFQNVTSRFVSSSNGYGGKRYLPYVYTEHGVVALAGVLKNAKAAEMSVEIVRKFIAMRNFIRDNGNMLLSLAKLQNRQIEFENETIAKFDEINERINHYELPKTAIFYKGECYDAYAFIVSIIEKAKKSILLIDRFLDEKAFLFLRHRKEEVMIHLIHGNNNKLQQDEVDKYMSQYGEIDIIVDDTFHDRYLVIDDEEYYALGSSLNFLGERTFGVYKIEKCDAEKLIKYPNA